MPKGPHGRQATGDGGAVAHGRAQEPPPDHSWVPDTRWVFFPRMAEHWRQTAVTVGPRSQSPGTRSSDCWDAGSGEKL